MKRSSVLTAVAALALLHASAPAFALAHEYPTKDRVEYVQACQREFSARPAQEMLYKCSCVIDQLAEQLDYDQFVDGTTAFYASSIAGERGQVLRSEQHTHDLADAFRNLQGKARKACFVN